MTIELINSQDEFCELFDENCNGCPMKVQNRCDSWNDIEYIANQYIINHHRNRNTYAKVFFESFPDAKKGSDGYPVIPVFLVFPNAQEWGDEYVV